MEKKSEQKPVVVQVTLTGVSAKRFEDSAAASARSARQEALIRLEDHLSRFSSIATKGETVDRN